MRLFQNGAIQFKFPSHLARRPPTTTRPFSRNHQHRTKSSDSTPSDPPEKPDTNPPKPSHTQPNPHPPGSVASSAGASTPPVPGPAASRSLTQIIQAGPVGRAGRSYSRVQDRRPYLTQIVSSLVVYLCGDLSAQVLFPSESPKEAKDEDKARDENEEESDPEPTGSYDPMRTLRHLTVGIVSSIPSYKWYLPSLPSPN